MNWGLVFNIFIGSIPAVAIVGGFFVRFDRKLTVWMIEHEILVSYWEEMHPTQKFPTRMRRVGS